MGEGHENGNGNGKHENYIIDDTRVSVDIINTIDNDPTNAVHYLTEHNEKYKTSTIHLLLTLIENGRYGAAEKDFLALDTTATTPGRIHKHITDISSKINEYINSLNKDETDDEKKKQNIIMGGERKKHIVFKFFPEQAKIIYDTENQVAEVIIDQPMS